MDALVMCGGKGTRLGTTVEKPLYEIAGKPMVKWVCSALTASSVETTYAVVSPHAPETKVWVEERLRDVPTIETPGDGYVADLQYALAQVERPVLTVAADLPLLDGSAIDAVIHAYEGNSLTVCVPVERKRGLGVSVGTTMAGSGDGDKKRAPAGVNIVGDTDSDTVYVSDDVRFAVNVNYVRDAQIAQALRRKMDGDTHPLDSQHGDS